MYFNGGMTIKWMIDFNFTNSICATFKNETYPHFFHFHLI